MPPLRVTAGTSWYKKSCFTLLYESLTRGDKMRLIRISEVIDMTGLSRSCIYRYINEERFPMSVSLSPRSVAWVESEIQQWIAERVERRHDNALYGYG